VRLGAEFDRLEPDLPLLRRIAEVTGGRVLDPDEPVAAGLFDREGVRPAVSRTPLWPLLMGWFLAVMLADIATRRIGWDRFISPAIGGWGVPRARGSSVDRGVEAAARAASLRQGRSLKPGSASGRALHEGDVAAVREEQARRRYEAERARLASLRQGIVGATPSGGKAEKTPPKPDEGASGLMAAKRRAQARIREEEDDGSGGGTV
jgi:hypothetical protein